MVPAQAKFKAPVLLPNGQTIYYDGRPNVGAAASPAPRPVKAPPVMSSERERMAEEERERVEAAEREIHIDGLVVAKAQRKAAKAAVLAKATAALVAEQAIPKQSCMEQPAVPEVLQEQADAAAKVLYVAATKGMAMELAQARSANEALHKSAARATKDYHELEQEVAHLRASQGGDEQWQAPVPAGYPADESGNTRPAGSSGDGRPGTSPLDYHRERNNDAWSWDNSWSQPNSGWGWSNWNHYGASSANSSNDCWWQRSSMTLGDYGVFKQRDDRLRESQAAEQRHNDEMMACYQRRNDEMAADVTTTTAEDWRECQTSAYVSVTEHTMSPANAEEKYDLARFCKHRVESFPIGQTPPKYARSAIRAIENVEDEDLRTEMLADLDKRLAGLSAANDGAVEGQAGTV